MEEEYMKVFEELVDFVKRISVADNDEDSNILSEVREKVNGVHRDLPRKISSNTELAYFFIKDSRSAVIKALNDVCDKLSDLSIKAGIQDYVASLQQQQQQLDDDCSSFDDDEVDVDVDDDVDDTSDSDDGHPSGKSLFFQRKDILDLEIKYYDQALNFLTVQLLKTADKEPVPESKPHPDYITLSYASSVIRFVRYDLESTSLCSGDYLNSMITDSRSTLVTFLNTARTKLTNPTIKDDLDRFIQDLRPQVLPPQIFDSSLDYTNGNNRMSEMTAIELKPESCSGEGESGSGGCKSTINLPENHEAKDEYDDIVDYFDGYDKFLEEQEERYFPRFVRIGNWDPEYEGQGISLLDPSAVRDQSKNQSFFVNMTGESSKLVWEDSDLANMSEGSPKFLPEDESFFVNMTGGSSKLLWEDESDLSNMSEGSSKFPPEDEPDLADMSQGSPNFRPEDELDHANTREGNLKG